MFCFFPLALCTGQGAAHFFVCFLASVEPTCWFCFLTFLFIVRKFAERAIVLDLPHVLHLGGEKLGEGNKFWPVFGWNFSSCIYLYIYLLITYLFILCLLMVLSYSIAVHFLVLDSTQNPNQKYFWILRESMFLAVLQSLTQFYT